MISGIADTLARSGEWKLLEGLMNPILMYAESGRWNAPFCPPDVGAYPYAMHRITEDMDYEWITQKALDIVADIDSLAGNADYSDKYEKTLDKWRNYIKQ